MASYLPYIIGELLLGAAFVSLLTDESPATAAVLSAIGDIIRDAVAILRGWWGVSGRHVRYEGRHEPRAVLA